MSTKIVRKGSPLQKPTQQNNVKKLRRVSFNVYNIFFMQIRSTHLMIYWNVTLYTRTVQDLRNLERSVD